MKGEKCCIQVDGDKEEPRKLNYPHFPLFLLPPVIWHCQRVTGWLTSACLGCCFLASQTIFFLIAIISHHFHVDGCQAVRTVNIWLKLIEQLGSAEHTHTRKKKKIILGSIVSKLSSLSPERDDVTALLIITFWTHFLGPVVQASEQDEETSCFPSSDQYKLFFF